jgi:hypothetical protein
MTEIYFDFVNENYEMNFEDNKMTLRNYMKAYLMEVY